MTKKELTQKVAEKTGLTVVLAAKVIDSVIETSIYHVSQGGTVYLRGFGTLGAKVRKAKTGMDIGRRILVKIPECSIPFFKPSSLFKKKLSALNRGF